MDLIQEKIWWYRCEKVNDINKKNGITREDRIKRKWKLTEEEKDTKNIKIK